MNYIYLMFLFKSLKFIFRWWLYFLCVSNGGIIKWEIEAKQKEQLDSSSIAYVYFSQRFQKKMSPGQLLWQRQ